MSSVHPISARGYDVLRRNLVNPESAESPGPFLRKIGKYRVLRELGQGGMAIVYEAEDPELRRRVALKVLRGDATDARMIQRLHREAAIGAQLRHPNIVRIFEVGMVEDPAGAPVQFIAMDFVEGTTLEELLHEGKATRAELLRIMESVSDAVAYAHEQGVIHRDLKPSNVLLDTAGRVALADFGLARATSFVTPLTRANGVLGTPAYMPPEQIEGRAQDIGARSDVYSLGVMLYRILAGRLPFEGETVVALFEQILRKEPPPPSRIDRTTDRDLESICLKAMAKERGRRYATARGFQEDLRRHIDGKPVLARPPSAWYLGRKRLARHRTAAMIAAVSVIAIGLTATGLTLRARTAEQRAIESREQALRQLQHRTQTALAAALELRRAGRLDEMRRFTAETEGACREMIDQWPAVAEPHYRLGRMYRAVLKDGQALEQQELALKKEPGSAPARYERVILNAKQYHRELREAVVRFWRGQGERMAAGQVPARHAIGTDLDHENPRLVELRRAMKRDLAALVRGADPAIGPAELSCAKGLLAMAEDEPTAAHRHFTEAFTLEPALEDACEGLANLDLARGDWAASVRGWTEGIRRDQGYFPYFEGRGTAHAQGGSEAACSGADPTDLLEKAILDFTEALAKAPPSERPHLLVSRGCARTQVGDHRSNTGTDPSAAYGAAIRDFDEASGLAPTDGAPWIQRAFVRQHWAMQVLMSGRNPAEQVNQGIEDADGGVARSPDREDAWRHRAVLKLVQAHLGSADPSPSYEAAVQDLKESLARRPDREDTWMALGLCHQEWGLDPRCRDGKARGRLESAVSCLDEAVKRAAGRYEAWKMRGDAHKNLAIHMTLEGGESVASYDAAIGDYSMAVQLNPGSYWAWLGRASVRRLVAAMKENRGGDPSADLGAALEDLAGALKAGGGEAKIKMERGCVRLAMGERKFRAGGDAMADLEAAVADLGEVVKAIPAYAEGFKFRGGAHVAMARCLAARRLDASGSYRAARADLERAVELDPRLEPVLRRLVAECRALPE